jgi:bacteriocin biosynthesis cyclodehydratase domain-containing protein
VTASGEPTLLAPWLRRADVDDRIVLEYADELAFLGGPARPLLDELLPLLDGTRSTAELAAAVEQPPARIEGLLAELSEHGLVVPGPQADATATLCAALATPPSSPAATAGRLSAATLTVVGDARCAAELCSLLEPSLREVRRGGWDGAESADLVAVVPSPAELPLLEEWNAVALESRQPWLQVLPFNGRLAALGPLFVPGETCCHECFRRRRAAALDEHDVLPRLDRMPADYPDAPAIAAACAGLAATLVLRWLAYADAHVPGTLYALELRNGLAIDAHRVLRLPRCPACSPVADAAPVLPWPLA